MNPAPPVTRTRIVTSEATCVALGDCYDDPADRRCTTSATLIRCRVVTIDLDFERAVVVARHPRATPTNRPVGVSTWTRCADRRALRELAYSSSDRRRTVRSEQRGVESVDLVEEAVEKLVAADLPAAALLERGRIP